MDQAEDCGITNLELFSMFKKFDKNLNGVLEMNEYIDCLRSMGTEFSEQELVSLSVMADINGDN